MKLTFLGSGGSSRMMATQVRKTGGMLFDLGTKFVVDPGPGSLYHAIHLGFQPEKMNGVLVSHLHPDHCTDANAYLDAIEKPFLIAEQHCVKDKKVTKSKVDYFPCISVFHQRKSKVHAVKAGDKVKINDVEINVTKADHYDPTVGFRIRAENIDVGYTSDGSYFRGMEKYFDGCTVLIANVIIPKGQNPQPHKYMSIDNLIKLVNAMKDKPDLIIISHLNLWMLRSNMWKQEKIVQDAVKVKTIHAEDFMTVDLKTLQVTKYKK